MVDLKVLSKLATAAVYRNYKTIVFCEITA
jgi:hypothetical protein